MMVLYNTIGLVYMHIISVVMNSPIGYGISGLNVMGNNSLQNVTIIMGRDNLHNYIFYACSYGVHWMYGDIMNSDDSCE